MAEETKLDLYTDGTPNGCKISCTLEELGIKYNVHHVDISKGVQKESWYLENNPNGRIPAIVDRTLEPPKRVFEGAAIQLYLCEKYDKEHRISFPYDTEEYWEVVEWMIWMQSGIGPMQGQCNHFYRYAPTKIDYAIDRYQNETKRLYQVLNDRLASQKAAGKGLWVVGGKFTIADLSCHSWMPWAGWAGIDTGKFPELQTWLETIQQRPAIDRGLNVPVPFKLKGLSQAGMDDLAKEVSSWVMKGAEKDAEEHK